MKTRDWRKVIFMRQNRRPVNELKYSDVCAFDTETCEGLPYLLADSDHNSKDIETLDDVLKFLTPSKNLKTINFFYNLQYDVQGILKFIERDELLKIYHLGKIAYEDVILSLIPRKYFSIKKGNRVYKFYDLFQFFHSSLDDAAQVYLDKAKIEVDHALFNDREYIRKNLPFIKKCCIQDCTLTKELADYLYTLFAQANIPLVKPFSAAYISQKYFQSICDIPIAAKHDYQKYAFYSYSGGRFEVFKRGYFEEFSNIDLNSAYPYQISKLIDMNNGRWFKDKVIPEVAYYGFLRCKITVKEKQIAPLPFGCHNVIVYPRVTKCVACITLEEYNFIIDNNLGEIEIVDGWFFEPYEIVYPFKKITDLYNYRVSLKKAQNKLEYVFKLMLNSKYGKLLQLTPKLIEITDFEENDDVVDIVGDNWAMTCKRVYKSGQLFNPVYAAMITANTRLECHKFILENDISPIGVFTDGILVDEKSNYQTSKLGAWNTDCNGELVILGSGVYSARFDNKVETRFRGFAVKKHVDLFSLLEKNKSESGITLDSKKAVGLGEWLNHHMQFHENDLNRILLMQKKLHINFDQKRKWERDFKNCGDALRSQIPSCTLKF